ncbi:MAG: hypothetical protein WC480_03550 [Patescibacteria group bacterium]
MSRLNKRGQTILEVVVVSGIVVGFLISVLGLLVINNKAQADIEVQLLGNQLAREGIELVRNIRDSNWLDPDQVWSDGLLNPNDNEGVVNMDYLTGELSIDFSINNITQARLYNHETALGNRYISYDPNNNATPLDYYRLITIDPVCDTALPPQICDPVSDNIIGLKIISQVAIEIKGVPKFFSLQDYLYNWK